MKPLKFFKLKSCCSIITPGPGHLWIPACKPLLYASDKTMTLIYLHMISHKIPFWYLSCQYFDSDCKVTYVSANYGNFIQLKSWIYIIAKNPLKVSWCWPYCRKYYVSDGCFSIDEHNELCDCLIALFCNSLINIWSVVIWIYMCQHMYNIFIEIS